MDLSGQAMLLRHRAEAACRDRSPTVNRNILDCISLLGVRADLNDGQLKNGGGAIGLQGHPDGMCSRRQARE
jgi:hypothetical protein